jgi:hypothetical protein
MSLWRLPLFLGGVAFAAACSGVASNGLLNEDSGPGNLNDGAPATSDAADASVSTDAAADAFDATVGADSAPTEDATPSVDAPPDAPISVDASDAQPAVDASDGGSCEGQVLECDGGVFLDRGTAPACVCANTIPCASDNDCTGPSAPTGLSVCDLVPSDPTYGTCQECSPAEGCTAPAFCDEIPTDRLLASCVQCDSANTAACGASKVCDLSFSSRDLDTCVQCDEAQPTCATGVCDTTSTDVGYDSCVACLPANGTTNATCQGANAAFPLCAELRTNTIACVQCDATNAATICPSGQCAIDGHCVCDGDAGIGCPAGSTCVAAGFGECQ